MNSSHTRNLLGRLLEQLGWVDGILVGVCVLLILAALFWAIAARTRPVWQRAMAVAGAAVLAFALIVAVVLIADAA